jgi:hypothetical protein
MKHYDLLVNTEKAAMLYDLFPEAIPPAMQWVKKETAAILKDPEAIRKEMKKSIIHPDLWLHQADFVNKKVEEHEQACKNSKKGVVIFKRDFVNLFEDPRHSLLMMVHCLTEFAKTKAVSNIERRFKLMADALF